MQLLLESFNFCQVLSLQGLVCVNHIPNLILKLSFQQLYRLTLAFPVFLFFLQTSFLKLFQGHFKLPLWVNKISFVGIFLLFKEWTFSFPKGLIPVIIWLDILKFSLKFLELGLKSHHVLSLGGTNKECLTCSVIEACQLLFQSLGFVEVVWFLVVLFGLQSINLALEL